MISDLLWRCPLCQTHDALLHQPRRLGGDRLHCTGCQAIWGVRRKPGDDYYLNLVKPGSSGVHMDYHPTHSLAEWYSQMKKTLSLNPISSGELQLPAGEVLFLASKVAELEVEADDPLFFPGSQDNFSHQDKSTVPGVNLGQGKLFLTDQRLIWQTSASNVSPLPKVVSFSLSQVNSAYGLLNFGLLLMVGMRLYTLRFPQESILKWITYLAMVAQEVQMRSGHRIATSHY